MLQVTILLHHSGDYLTLINDVCNGRVGKKQYIVAHFASNKMNILFVALLHTFFFISTLRCDNTLKSWIRVCVMKSFEQPPTSKTFEKNCISIFPTANRYDISTQDIML